MEILAESEQASIPETPSQLRVLILAPTGNDAVLTARFLEQAGLPVAVCGDMEELCHSAEAGSGALLLAEESLTPSSIEALAALLEKQPPWSDLPIILITGEGEAVRVLPRFREVNLSGNISLVERPVHPETIVTMCEVALRSRQRQYQGRDLLRQLRAGDRKKDEFLAMLAHELRNPLAAVCSAAALLKSPDFEDREWAGGVIHRQSAHLARLIDDLLDVSRITTGKIRLKREVLDVASILDRARDSVRGLVAARGHTLDCAYPTGALWIEADPTRAEQVVINLLTNAAKYTPPGGRIELIASRGEDEIRILVRDNGVGIEPHRLPEMFELFAQGERSVARSEGGLGLGLTIIKRLLELHNGRIEAESEGLNCGSSFTACFPAACPRAAASERGLVTSATRRRNILIVDDNVDTAEALGRLLSRAGHQTTVVYSANAALRMARATSPNTVVMDIGLPEIDGYEVVRRMRQETWSNGTLFIAVTGYGQAEDRQRAREAGFDHHLTKPIEMDQLKTLLNQAPSLLGK